MTDIEGDVNTKEGVSRIKLITLLYERREFFLGLIWEHLCISGIAIVLALMIGLLMGIFISEYKTASRFVMGVTNVIYTIPSISMLGFLIPFSGIGNTTAIIALTLYGLLPMIRNTCTGIGNIDPEISEAAKGMGSTRWQILFRVKVPLALPVILSGLKTMVVMTVSVAGIASFVGAGGLGVAIYRGITTNNATMTTAGSLLIALMALLLDGLFGLLERQIPWTRRKTLKECRE